MFPFIFNLKLKLRAFKRNRANIETYFQKRRHFQYGCGLSGTLYLFEVIQRSFWLCIGTVSFQSPPYQPVFTAAVTEVVLWLQLVGGCACLVIFCEGGRHVASKMRYFSLADFQEINACYITTRDSIQATKGQPCVCVTCRQCWDNWLRNIVWCRGNLYRCILLTVYWYFSCDYL